MLKEYLQWIYSLFLCFGLERNGTHFSDGNEKEGSPNDVVHYYEGWTLTLCQSLC